MNVLIILGHPRTDSLCGALADAYGKGAREAGTEVRRLDLATLDFDPDVHTPSPNQQAFEDDIRKARALILWAEHLVFVYPTWWGTLPALLKGFLDRVLTPDFAFITCEGGTGYQGLLGGRSAQLITTMDTPPASMDSWRHHRPLSCGSDCSRCSGWPDEPVEINPSRLECA